MTALAGALGVGVGIHAGLNGHGVAAALLAAVGGGAVALRRARRAPYRIGRAGPACAGALLGVLAVAAAGPVPVVTTGPAAVWVEARADGTDVPGLLLAVDGSNQRAAVRLELDAPVRAGDRLVVDAVVRPPSPFGIAHGDAARVSGAVLAREPGGVWWRTSGALRDAVMAGTVGLPVDEAALAAGLLIGNDDGFSEAEQAAFEATGLVHLTAVSGANVALVLGWFFVATRRLRRGPRLASAAPVLLLFALVTALQPSVLRASAVAGVALIARGRGRCIDPVVVGAVGVASLLVAAPRLLLTAGFQLSLAAAAGVVAIGVPLARRWRGPLPVRTALAVTLGAQIGVAPVLAWHFGAVSAVGLVANVVAVPLAALATTTSALACTATATAPAIAAWAHRVDGPWLDLLLGIARTGAELPGASLPTATPGGAGLGACMLAATWLAGRLRAGRPVGLAAPTLALTYLVVLRPGAA